MHRRALNFEHCTFLLRFSRCLTIDIGILLYACWPRIIPLLFSFLFPSFFLSVSFTKRLCSVLLQIIAANSLTFGFIVDFRIIFFALLWYAMMILVFFLSLHSENTANVSSHIAARHLNVRLCIREGKSFCLFWNMVEFFGIFMLIFYACVSALCLSLALACFYNIDWHTTSRENARYFCLSYSFVSLSSIPFFCFAVIDDGIRKMFVSQWNPIFQQNTFSYWRWYKVHNVHWSQ